MDKPTLVYFNPDCFADTDVTVLCHIVQHFKVIWFYLYDSCNAKSMRYNPAKAKEYADKNGITLEVVDSKMRRRNLKNLFFYKDVAKTINRYNPDLVYACNVFPFWTYCYSLIKCKNKVLGLHDVSMHSYKFSLARYFIQYNKERWIKRFNNFITYSQNQQTFLKQGFGKDSYMVGMSCKTFGETTMTAPNLSEGVKLLFFGIISKYKGLDLLIDTLEQLRAEGLYNFNLTIAGKGESWDECKALIKTPELYNLQVRFIENSEIADLMGSHHFIVLPYRDATQSGPLVTAIGYGLPVIAPSFGCFTELLCEDNAILYKQGELKKALLKVSNMSQKEYNSLRESISLLKENYSEENIAKNYINAFFTILGESEK